MASSSPPPHRDRPRLSQAAACWVYLGLTLPKLHVASLCACLQCDSVLHTCLGSW